jgi:hypothetical protein
MGQNLEQQWIKERHYTTHVVRGAKAEEAFPEFIARRGRPDILVTRKRGASCMISRTARFRAGTTFSDMHIALAQAVAGNEAALEAREGQIEELARNSRYTGW